MPSSRSRVVREGRASGTAPPEAGEQAVFCSSFWARAGPGERAGGLSPRGAESEAGGGE